MTEHTIELLPANWSFKPSRLLQNTVRKGVKWGHKVIPGDTLRFVCNGKIDKHAAVHSVEICRWGYFPTASAALNHGWSTKDGLWDALDRAYGSIKADDIISVIWMRLEDD